MMRSVTIYIGKYDEEETIADLSESVVAAVHLW
jgi:hypothetical protein